MSRRAQPAHRTPQPDQGQRLGGPVAGPDRPGLHPPRTKIVGDITYLPTAEDWLYLASWLDLATREVIGYSMADHHRAELVVDALDGRRAGPPGTGMRDPQRPRIGRWIQPVNSAPEAAS